MHRIKEKTPGIIIAGLKGGSGKTIISLGITAAWKKKGIKVSPFKKGPDYIDAGWLSRAAGRPCYNLDTFLCTSSAVRQSYRKNSLDSDIAVVEGNRGLYDGIDTEGSTSTSELAKLLALPVLLVLDCTKSTRTMAALLMGCMNFDSSVNIFGVVLNRVAGKRHEGKLRSNIEKFCGTEVFGAVPKIEPGAFPERHMGLVTQEEHSFSDRAVEKALKTAEDHIDLDRLYKAVTRKFRQPCKKDEKKISKIRKKDSVTIGVVRDSAFQFYYPDNLDALKSLGARIVFISPLREKYIPDVDAIYMGGGFPETHASQLSDNHKFKDNLKSLSRKGLPIYAECGGLIFLGKSISIKDREYSMSGILPVSFGLSKRPQGHGYTRIKVVNENPFYRRGETLKGHEFRYSSIRDIEYSDHEMAFKMERGKGILDKKDGFFKNNTFGTYTHIHALGTLSWAPSLVNRAVLKKRDLS